MKFLNGLLIGLNVVAVVVAIANGVREFVCATKEDGDAQKKVAYYEGYIDGRGYGNNQKNKEAKDKIFSFGKKKEA